MSDPFVLLDSVQEGVVVVDGALSIRFWNHMMASWTGISATEATGRPLEALAPKLRDGRYLQPLRAVVEQGAPATFSAAIHEYVIPCPYRGDRFRLQDTMVRAVSLDGETLALLSVVDRTDHIANIRGLKQVNTKLKRTMRLRRESDRINTMLAAGMDNAAEAILVVDHRGRVEYANPMFYRMAQLDVPSIRGRLLVDLLRTDQGEVLQREVGRAIASGEMWRGRVVVCRPDGSRFPASVSAAPVRLRKGRRILHAVLTLEDLTEYELANHDLQERKKHEAMLTMVAGIYHDFNNILSGMVGNTYLLRKSVQGDEKGERRLAAVEEALNEATEVIRGLVIYARGEEAVQGVLPLLPFIKEWCKEVRAALPEGVELRQELQMGHFPVRVDVTLLKQALMAVAENAIDAVAESEHPEISICFLHNEEQHTVELTLRDNGCGIPDELLPRVWEPFFTTKPRGTGLGLTMAKKNIEHHHGTIRIESAVGEGTSVFISLPLAES